MAPALLCLILMLTRFSWAWSNCTIVEATTTDLVVETPSWMYPLSYSPCEACAALIVTDLNQPITSNAIASGITTRYVAGWFAWNFQRTKTVTVIPDTPQTPSSQIQTWLANPPYLSAEPVTKGDVVSYTYCYEHVIEYVVEESNYAFAYPMRVTITSTATYTFTTSIGTAQATSQWYGLASSGVHTPGPGQSSYPVRGPGPAAGTATFTTSGVEIITSGPFSGRGFASINLAPTTGGSSNTGSSPNMVTNPPQLLTQSSTTLGGSYINNYSASLSAGLPAIPSQSTDAWNFPSASSTETFISPATQSAPETRNTFGYSPSTALPANISSSISASIAASLFASLSASISAALSASLSATVAQSSLGSPPSNPTASSSATLSGGMSPSIFPSDTSISGSARSPAMSAYTSSAGNNLLSTVSFAPSATGLNSEATISSLAQTAQSSQGVNEVQSTSSSTPIDTGASNELTISSLTHTIQSSQSLQSLTSTQSTRSSTHFITGTTSELSMSSIAHSTGSSQSSQGLTGIQSTGFSIQSNIGTSSELAMSSLASSTQSSQSSQSLTTIQSTGSSIQSKPTASSEPATSLSVASAGITLSKNSLSSPALASSSLPQTSNEIAPGPSTIAVQPSKNSVGFTPNISPTPIGTGESSSPAASRSATSQQPPTSVSTDLSVSPGLPASASPNPSAAASTAVPIPSPAPGGNQTFRLFVSNNVSGLDQLAVGESGTGQLVVGGVPPTVLQITNATNMTDLDGNYIYFIPKGGSSRLSRRQDTDPTLQYAPDPPPDAVTSGFSLQNITLSSNTTEGNYTFYTCNRTADEQPIYVAEVGQTPGRCFSFDVSKVSLMIRLFLLFQTP